MYIRSLSVRHDGFKSNSVAGMTKSYNTPKHIKSTLPISSLGWFYPSILGWPGTSSLPCWLGVPLQPRQQGLFLCWLLLQGMSSTCVKRQHPCPRLGGVHLPMWRKCFFHSRAFLSWQDNNFSKWKWPISTVLKKLRQDVSLQLWSLVSLLEHPHSLSFSAFPFFWGLWLV